MVKKQIRSGDYLKGHILLIFILIMALLVSGCAIPWYEKYKLSEEQAAIDKSTNLKGEVKIFYAIRRASESHEFSGLERVLYNRKPPRYGITEPHLVDDISYTQLGFILFLPLQGLYDPDMGPHVKIEIVKKDQVMDAFIN